MKKFHIKSIILGIGIGIVLTSLISMIYTAGVSTQKLSEAEVIELAKKYGMVEKKDLNVNNTNTVVENKENVEEAADKSNEVVSTPEPENEFVVFTIDEGDTSEIVADKLLENKLIDDKQAFISQLTDLDLSSKISYGSYNIRKGSSIREIIDIIAK